MDDKWIININTPMNKDDIISEIKSLKKQVPKVNQIKYEKYASEEDDDKSQNIYKNHNLPKTKTVVIEPELIREEQVMEQTITNNNTTNNNNTSSSFKLDDPEGAQNLLISSFGKKKKKKKKKNGLTATMISGGQFTDFTDEEVSIKNEDMSNLIDIEELLNHDDNDDIGDDIIDEQRRGYDKLKKQDNPYKKEFAEELTLLYGLLNEVNSFSKDLERKYRSMEDAKVRGISKYLTDLAQAVITSKQNKLAVIKEIASVKKIVTDFKFKVDAKVKEAEGGNTTDRLASTYLSKLLSYGRGNFVRDYGNNNKEDADIDPNEMLLRMNGSDNSEINNDKYDKLIEERLDGLDKPFRSDAGNKYIQYENLGVKIYIKKCVDTGEWEFIALDRDKQQIFDYPIPRKKDVGKVKFSTDGNYATDFSGRTYKVIEWFSPVDD